MPARRFRRRRRWPRRARTDPSAPRCRARAASTLVERPMGSQRRRSWRRPSWVVAKFVFDEITRRRYRSGACGRDPLGTVSPRCVDIGRSGVVPTDTTEPAERDPVGVAGRHRPGDGGDRARTRQRARRVLVPSARSAPSAAITIENSPRAISAVPTRNRPRGPAPSAAALRTSRSRLS